MNWHAVTREPNELGESPFWHPGEGRLYWVDIPACNILRADAESGAVQSWAMPSEPGCIAPAASGGLVIALRDGIYRAPQWAGALRLMRRFDHDTGTTRFNDGKADPLGRFWAGTMYEPRTMAAAELFALDCRDGRPLQVQRMAGDATIANGLAWSPDGRTVYWSDTPSHVIRAWDWDAQGNYYAAMFEGARLLKFSPSGVLLAEIPTPAQCPTMPCFGGEDLRTLFITTARHNRPQHELQRLPQSGCVFSTRVDTPGLPVNFFRD